MLLQMNLENLELMRISFLLLHTLKALINGEKENPEYYNQVVKGIPLQKFGDVENDIGPVAVFLASSDSQYVTGQTVMVDGGSIKLY